MRSSWTSFLLCLAVCVSSAQAFQSPGQSLVGKPVVAVSKKTSPFRPNEELPRAVSVLRSSTDDSEEVMLSTSDQTVLGVAGTISSLIVFISEYTLATTGCGLPAGPFGLYGLAEGISYLGVVGIGGYSAFTKIKTGSGLPAGPAGVLGAAEGLSFLAIVAGLVVLALQVTNYGYIPNAVPMEGGLCS